jgi:hypothetical protein
MRTLPALRSSLGRLLPAFGLLLAASPAAIAVDPAKIPDHALYADDRAQIQAPGAVSFAVMGNLRGTIPGADQRDGKHCHGGKVADAIVSDIHSAVQVPGGPAFLVTMGDMVRAGGVIAEWEALDKTLAPLLEGASPAPKPGMRIPSVPVVGELEAARDKRYTGVEGFWPGAGATIGYNRVASWSAFDVTTLGETWRFVVLDSGKKRLGSRWIEQMSWIPQAVKGDYKGLILFLHEGEVDLGGKELGMNPDNGPHELVEAVEAATQDLKLLAVFSAGSGSSSAVLPDGPFGALHMTAGGGGGPAEDLKRWGDGVPSGRKGDLVLEPLFDLAMMDALDFYARGGAVPEVALDEAKARGTYTGFTGVYNAQHFPTFGWWKVSVAGPYLQVAFRLHLLDGSFVDAYSAVYSEKDGWKGSKGTIRP